MATQAYVFVYVTSGTVEGVAKEVAQLDGVKSAHMCWGRPDVIAFIEVPTPTNLSQLVAWWIHPIEGVEATNTRLLRLSASELRLLKAKAEATHLTPAPYYTKKSNMRWEEGPASWRRLSRNPPSRNERE